METVVWGTLSEPKGVRMANEKSCLKTSCYGGHNVLKRVITDEKRLRRRDATASKAVTQNLK
jgi:hypothetical protein